MKKLFKIIHFIFIFIFILFVVFTCDLKEQKLRREMLRVSDLQDKYIEKYLKLPFKGSYELKKIYNDSIQLYRDSVHYFYIEIYPKNIH